MGQADDETKEVKLKGYRIIFKSKSKVVLHVTRISRATEAQVKEQAKSETEDLKKRFSLDFDPIIEIVEEADDGERQVHYDYQEKRKSGKGKPEKGWR